MKEVLVFVRSAKEEDLHITMNRFVNCPYHRGLGIPANDNGKMQKFNIIGFNVRKMFFVNKKFDAFIDRSGAWHDSNDDGYEDALKSFIYDCDVLSPFFICEYE